ncbi:hypothetical protein FUA48_04715 [Flavobacterium alkalisoli]|uniref:MarR family transcriptional regulator n=1 Tax=Flavobacterium alkalisoli TaxID=2602769 RepID=A0A5B9FVS9_9FLAO|nr:hypothetical protein [Flavobacterium alkalisoli]QEE48902.1 hypothetical protein FUA48_04715 [Flavobacterium alkalisoli]
MSDLSKDRDELVELFGIHFETHYNLPPLAGRIMGTLIVDCKQAMTFEALVEKLSASKSSISTNLNLLLKMGKIRYYTLPGDRKKYFKPAPFSERLESYVKMVEQEKILVDKMLSYRERTASCPLERFDLTHVQAYKDHVLEIGNLLEKTIEQFKQIEKERIDQFNSNINNEK